MPAFKLSNPLRRDPARPSLKARAAALRASAARVIGRKPVESDDPLRGRACPPGFVPYPVAAPMAWLRIPGMLAAEGERLLAIAEAELQRRMAERADGTENERRSRETRLHRALRIDALRVLSGRMDPPGTPWPEPGSAAARAAFKLACTRTDRLDRQAVEGYPELQRPDRPVPTWWGADDLSHALERGEIAATEYARLSPLASEREQRIRAATLATNVGALFALAHADTYPTEADDTASDLALCTVPQLARLYEHLQAVWQHLSGATCAPCFYGPDKDGGFNAAGRILDAEYDRFAALLEAIRDEARSRPAADEDANERLLILTRHALICDDRLPADLASGVAAAWGAAA